MTLEELNQIKEYLLVERNNLEISNNDLRSIEKNLDGDEIDIANAIVAEEFNNRIYSRNLIYLDKIKLAFLKMDNGSYGICSSCEEEIEIKRLMARPTTELCLPCKEVEEFSSNKTKVGILSKSRAKMGYKE